MNNLRKIQEACCFAPPTTSKKGNKKGRNEEEEDFGEEEFNNEMMRCVLRILSIKKGEPVGDRLIRFLCLFLKYAAEKGWFLNVFQNVIDADEEQIRLSSQVKMKVTTKRSSKHRALACSLNY